MRPQKRWSGNQQKPTLRPYRAQVGEQLIAYTSWRDRRIPTPGQKQCRNICEPRNEEAGGGVSPVMVCWGRIQQEEHKNVDLEKVEGEGEVNRPALGLVY